MKRSILALIPALLLSLAPLAHAKGATADAYFGYSRVGANLYSPYTSGMNGWQIAGHIKPIPFLGVEGDFSHYGGDAGAGTQHATTAMLGPRVTAGTLGFSAFVHALAGTTHFSSNAVAGLPGISYNALSYTLGAGVDIPVFLGLKVRVTGDYLGNNKAPSSQYSPAHYRIGAGVAYHFKL